MAKGCQEKFIRIYSQDFTINKLALAMLKITDAQDKILDKALKFFGKEEQVKCLIEELTELSLALQHGLKKGFDYEHIAEETADVFIAIQYMKKIFDFRSFLIEEQIDYKILRLKNRIENFKEDNFKEIEHDSEILTDLENQSFLETVRLCQDCNMVVPKEDMYSIRICNDCRKNYNN